MKYDKANASGATSNIIKAQTALNEAQTQLKELSGIEIAPLITQLKQSNNILTEVLDNAYSIENTIYLRESIRESRSNIYDAKSD